MSGTAIQTIIQKLPQGLSNAALARMAGVNPSYLSRMLCGKVEVSSRMATRLRFAALRLAAGEDRNSGISALYRALVVICATQMGQDPVAVQSTNPSANMVRSPAWMKRVFVQWVARHLMCDVFGFRQSDVANAIGMTRAAVNKSVKNVIERQDTDPELARQLEIIEDMLLGGAV